MLHHLHCSLLPGSEPGWFTFCSFLCVLYALSVFLALLLQPSYSRGICSVPYIALKTHRIACIEQLYQRNSELRHLLWTGKSGIQCKLFQRLRLSRKWLLCSNRLLMVRSLSLTGSSIGSRGSAQDHL